jgi:uncharacterized protein YjbI with pentapeptide repeats
MKTVTPIVLSGLAGLVIGAVAIAGLNAQESNWLFTLAIIAFLAFVIACWVFPKLLLADHTSSITAGKDQAELEDKYRATVAQVLGGAALAFVFAATLLKDRETLDQGKVQLANQQFVEGAKLLKEDVGPSAAGVNALGQVAATQAKYQAPVVTTLVSFIKSGRPAESDTSAPGRIPANIQAALSVIAKRDQSSDEKIGSADKMYRQDGGSFLRLNFYRAYLVGARFAGLGSATAFRNVNFQAASLYGADFHGLDLSNTAFDGSWMADWDAFGDKWDDDNTPKDKNYIAAKHLFTVNFEGAKLIQAGFDNVGMGGANLVDTDLAGASFYRANLSRADLTGTKNIKGASFEEATLTNAVFAKRDLNGVNFKKAVLNGTNFEGARNVDSAEFTGACSSGRAPPLFDQGVAAKVKIGPCTP